jgi:hypothetical protein
MVGLPAASKADPCLGCPPSGGWYEPPIPDDGSRWREEQQRENQEQEREERIRSNEERDRARDSVERDRDDYNVPGYPSDE